MARGLLALAFLACLSSSAVPQAAEFHRLTHHGQVLEYALILPDRFDKTISYPVLLALPPGGWGSLLNCVVQPLGIGISKGAAFDFCSLLSAGCVQGIMLGWGFS